MSAVDTARRMVARRRVPSWIAVGAIGAALFVSGIVMDAAAADVAPYPITIDGAGDADIVGELVSWQNAMFGAEQPVDFQYFQRGSKDGRSLLLAGLSEFITSSVPFTTAELDARPDDAGEIIDVPLSVGSTAIVIARPAQTGWDTMTEPCDLTDPNVDPDAPECAPVTGELTGPIRIPPENLAAMIVGLPGDAGSLGTWTSPSLEAALGTSDLIFQNLRPAARPTFLNRTEGTAQSMSLQLYAQRLAPTAWAEIKQSDPQFAWEPVGEVFSPRTPSRNGLDTQLGLMSLSDSDPITNSSPPNWTGNMGPIPTTLVPKLLRENPDDGYQVVEVQNANHDWVVPTRVSLDAALAAGTEMNFAADHVVADAYPMVYINRLYTIAGELAPEKANALAAMIRYVVTDGQQQLIDDGGTDLPDDLRAEALAQADAVVEKNCTVEGYEVTTSGPSAFEPDTAGVQAITSMKHCTLIPPPPATTTTTTTTTEPPTTTTTTEPPTTTEATTSSEPAAAVAAIPYAPPYVVQSPSLYTPPPVVQTTQPIAPETSVETTVAPTTTVVASEAPAAEIEPVGGDGSRPRGVALTRLPMESPDDGSQGFKKLGTLMLGAAMFLFGRRVVQSRRPPS